MGSRRGRVRIVMVAAAMALGPVVVACGGDDGGGADDGDVAALSDEAFCARFAELDAEFEQLSDEEAETRIPEGLTTLAAQAPTPELRDALVAVSGFFEQLIEIDDDDPGAFGEIFEILGDPSFIDATTTLDEYIIGTCGFDDTVFGVNPAD